MKKKITRVLFISLAMCTALLQSCSDKRAGMDVSEVDGMKIKTFYNNDHNVEIIQISDGGAMLIALPISTMAKARKMDDAEFKCLKKCKKSDGSYDMNCVLQCPVTKQLRMATF